MILFLVLTSRKAPSSVIQHQFRFQCLNISERHPDNDNGREEFRERYSFRVFCDCAFDQTPVIGSLISVLRERAAGLRKAQTKSNGSPMAAHDMPHQADVSASAPKKPFARVATKLLGPILDGAHHFSAYAAQMLAIKATKGPGFALNETQLGLPFEQGGYAIGRRGFRGGIALMKKAGVLNRTPKRRHYATEKPLANSGSFVHIEEALLRNNSKLVAFILVVNLTPTPISQVDAAARLGSPAQPSLVGSRGRRSDWASWSTKS